MSDNPIRITDFVVAKHGSHNQASHGKGRKGGAGGLSPEDDKKMDDLSVELFNLKQNLPLSVKTGKNTPEARLFRATFSSIVDQAAAILGKSPKEAFGELTSRTN